MEAFATYFEKSLRDLKAREWSSIPSLVLRLISVYILYWLVQAAYRLFFHPLSKYSGSPVAAISTAWYEWYWNIYKQGAMLFEIERLHKKHGPVIRIGVNDLHINDPEFYQSITKPASNFLKDPDYYSGVGFPHAILGMIDPVEHRIRKQVLAPAFSASQVQEIASRIEGKAVDMCKTFEEHTKSSMPVNIAAAFKAFALDVISELVIGQEFGALHRPGFRHPKLDVMRECIQGAWICRAFPIMSKISLALPRAITRPFFLIPMIEVALSTRSGLDQYLQDRDVYRLEDIPGVRSAAKDGESWGSTRRVSIPIERLLDPASAKDYQVLDRDGLNEEVLMLMGAGNDTTSNAMILGMYHICRSSQAQMRLEAELEAAYPLPGQAITYASVKQLPYLTATIKEVIRFTSPLPGRMPRVVPPEGYQLYGDLLRPGTVLHTSAYLLNRHPSVWGSAANVFDPSRWLDPSSTSLDKHMASFYRGSRQCIGVSLAWCELYLAFGTIFRRFNVAIHDTTDSDMEWMDYSFMLYVMPALTLTMMPFCYWNLVLVAKQDVDSKAKNFM